VTSPTLTLDQLDTMPDQQLLTLAAQFLREDAEQQGPLDDTERAVLALMDAGATACHTGDTRPVLDRLVQVARAMFREELAHADAVGSAT
jgi:hypothetical protein